MTAIIPFESAKLPAHLTRRIEGLNKDVLGAGPQFPVLSIKGKVWTLVKGKERKVITREVDGEQEPKASLTLTVVRANTKYRTFYAEAFSEDNSEGKKPDCYSIDGVAPAADSRAKQSKKCQGCPQNVWGAKEGGVGTACAVKTRLAVVDPEQLELDPEHEALLLNVPAASRKSFAQAVEAAEQRGIDYNALVMRVSFDKDAASPKLVFKPTGWLAEDVMVRVQNLYDSDIVKTMVGILPAAGSILEETGEMTEAAVQAQRAVETAKAVSKPKPKVEIDEDDVAAAEKPVAKAKPPKVEAEEVEAPVKPKAKAKPAVATVDDDTAALLADMDSLLGSTDD